MSIAAPLEGANRNQDVAYQHGDNDQAWVELQGSRGGWSLHLGNVESLGNPKASNVIPLPFLLR